MVFIDQNWLCHVFWCQHHPPKSQAWWSTSSSMASALAPVAGWMPLMPTASDGPSSSSWRPGREISPMGIMGFYDFSGDMDATKRIGIWNDLDRGFFQSATSWPHVPTSLSLSQDGPRCFWGETQWNTNSYPHIRLWNWGFEDFEGIGGEK